MSDEESTVATGTAPFDARFPNQQQTKSCWQNYIDYQKCIKAKGDEYEPCEFFYRNYKALCPNSWSDKWDDQIEEGKFAGKI